MSSAMTDPVSPAPRYSMHEDPGERNEKETPSYVNSSLSVQAATEPPCVSMRWASSGEKPHANAWRLCSRLVQTCDRFGSVSRSLPHAALLYLFCGPLAQLGERCVRNAEVGGSIPPRSTNQFGGIGIQARVTSSAIVSPISNASHMNPPTTTSFVNRVL